MNDEKEPALENLGEESSTQRNSKCQASSWVGRSFPGRLEGVVVEVYPVCKMEGDGRQGSNKDLNKNT